MSNKKYIDYPAGAYDITKIFLQASPSTGALEKVLLPLAVPSPTSQAGKFLSNDGTDVSWQPLSSAPSTSWQYNGMGITQDVTKGLYLINTTAATLALQQLSPSITLEGRGWKLNGPASSQQFSGIIDVLPVIGPANPTGQMRFGFRANGGSYVNAAFLTPASFELTSGLSATTLKGGSLGLIVSTQSISTAATAITYGGQIMYSALGTGIYNLHLFTGTHAPNGSAATFISMNLAPGFNNIGGGPSTNHYEVFRINMNEGAIPTGQNYLMRAGTGGTSFVSKFDITNSGQVIVGSGTISSCASLIANSTTQGTLLQRMTTTQKNAITTPVEGLEIFDLTLHKKCLYTGSVWETITST